MLKEIYVLNQSRAVASPARVIYCDTFFLQLRGLTFRSQLLQDEGLILVGKRDSRLDSSIHMLFVRFDLAVFWIDANMKVVDKIVAKSWRPAYFAARPAKFVLEIHPDRITDFNIDDVVEFKNA